MLKNIIERPVFATVISITLVILGIIGLSKLPLQKFPDIAPPAVQVSARYPGANAQTVLRSVAPAIEESINGVENMIYMTSTASNDGSLTITVYFKLGTNPDMAAVNVQNRVSQAMSKLPAEVVQQGVTTAKQQNSLVMVTGLTTEDTSKYSQTFLANYAQINIVPEIQRITGVGSAAIIGGVKDYSMRIWLKPDRMAAYHLTPKEVMDAIQDKSVEAAPGKFGESSPVAFEYILNYKGKLTDPQDYENITIRSNSQGSELHLKDVARVEFGSYTYGSITRNNHEVGVDIAILQLTGSNSNDIQIAINEFMAKASKKFPKGIKYDNFYSTKRDLDLSIEQVKHTLAEAFILVFLVVYLFLQDFRSTLIPAIAVPVAIIGTFFFMQIFGFSINLLTLFAMILAIGIVVDDAIVVVEAVHSKMEHTNLGPKQATAEAMHEITGAIISITLVMTAVFLPVGFLEGSTGVFYRQFAFTMAIAIFISAVNALTLSPALAALFLKEHHEHDGHVIKQNFKTRFFKGFNKGFDSMVSRYLAGAKFLIRHKLIGAGALVLICIAAVWMVKRTPTGFIPNEDQGFLAVFLSTPSGTSLSRTNEIYKQAEEAMFSMESCSYVNAIPGYNFLTSSNSPSSGIGFMKLKPTEERGKVKDINKIIDILRGKLARITGGSFFVFTFPTVPGFSNLEALDLILQDRSGGPLNKFSGVANDFIANLMKQKEIAVAFTTFKSDFPQYKLEIDEHRANQLGVNIKDILEVMQSYFGSVQANDFNRFGKYYRVMLQADIAERADASAMDKVYVKNKAGEMVPANELVKLTHVNGPETTSRYNLFNSIEVNVIPKPGYSSGQAIAAIQALAQKELPNGFSYEFSGQTREEISSGGQSVIIFIMSLVFVYLILSAQYESYILPLAVILSIPTGIVGVFAAIGLTGIENNIYVQVALVMLVGLLAKNAILIIEFALQNRKSGKTLVDSAIDAARMRIRPIIMTSLAFVFGLFPMSIATGPSAQGNHSISYGAAGGMISGVVLGLFIIPLLFVIFQALQEKISGKKKLPSVHDGLNAQL